MSVLEHYALIIGKQTTRDWNFGIHWAMNADNRRRLVKVAADEFAAFNDSLEQERDKGE